MHLKEIPGTDDIDVKAFWTFSHPSGNLTKDAGNRFWATTEAIADSYPCSPCKPGAQALAHGGHDAVSLLLGKHDAPQTPKHFENLVSMVNQANEIYQKKKRHHTRTPHVRD